MARGQQLQPLTLNLDGWSKSPKPFVWTKDELIKAFDVPAEAASISVAIDRASVPMEEEVPRPPGRPRKNAPKRSVRRVFHMCYCATVTLHDAEGRALHTLRRGQMPDRDAQDLCNLLANDVLVLREKRPDLLLTLLADGAPEMWRLLESNFPTSVFGRVHRCIDFWHVIEKLAGAAKVLAKDDEGARAMVWRWRQQLRRHKDAADMIRAELVASGREAVLVDGDRPVHDAITYLQNNAARMNYAGACRASRSVNHAVQGRWNDPALTARDHVPLPGLAELNLAPA